MGLVNITLLEQGQTGVNAAELNALVTPLQTEVNGKLDNNNIAANAAIACTKTNGSFGSVNISTSSGNIATSTGTLTVGGASTLSGTLAVTGAQTNAAGLKLTESTAPSTAANQIGLFAKEGNSQTDLVARLEGNGTEVFLIKDGVAGSQIPLQISTLSTFSTTSTSVQLIDFGATDYIEIVDPSSSDVFFAVFTFTGAVGGNNYFAEFSIIENSSGAYVNATNAVVRVRGGGISGWDANTYMPGSVSGLITGKTATFRIGAGARAENASQGASIRTGQLTVFKYKG